MEDMRQKVDNIINKLEEAILTKNIEKIRKAILDCGIIELMGYAVQKDCDSWLFRVRSQSTGEEYPSNMVVNFSYNPEPKIGRCNKENEPVLYTALESRTAVQEVIREDQEGRNIWLSIWQPKRPIRCLVFLFDPSKIRDKGTRKIYAYVVQELKKIDLDFEEKLPLYQWVSEQFLTEDYSFSSELCHSLFETHDIDGILYPSYAGKTHGLNLVLTKKFANDQLRFKDVLSLKIDEWGFPQRIRYMVIYESEINDGNVKFKQIDRANGLTVYLSEKRILKMLKKSNNIRNN